MALVFTLFGFAAFLLAMAAIVVLPLVLSPIGFGNLTETIAPIARCPVLLIVLLFGLAILYRYCPDRRVARWQWVSVGSVFATLTWFVASFLFSWYLANFANYNATMARSARSLVSWFGCGYRPSLCCSVPNSMPRLGLSQGPFASVGHWSDRRAQPQFRRSQ